MPSYSYPRKTMTKQVSEKKRLRLAVINLMPNKRETEAHWRTFFLHSACEIHVEFFKMGSHVSKSQRALDESAAYRVLTAELLKTVDGIVVTGAPVEKIPYEAVDYWEELKTVLLAAATEGLPTLSVCWGALAAAKIYHGADKTVFEAKYSGVFEAIGDGERYWLPHSRYATWQLTVPDSAWVLKCDDEIVAFQDGGHHLYCLGHPEYTVDVLEKEYLRDRMKGLDPAVPAGYSVTAGGGLKTLHRWTETAEALIDRWLENIKEREAEL